MELGIKGALVQLHPLNEFRLCIQAAFLFSPLYRYLTHVLTHCTMHVMKHVNTEHQSEKLSPCENKMTILEYLILSMHIKI